LHDDAVSALYCQNTVKLIVNPAAKKISC